ncbi:MAG: hypothetical protein CVV44_11730 [Spirochaetae bacterium HGW-Spirochaetae-1]|jgi:S-formylglutathione hydrolase FrmB|nr:MAG: hypothetical protein CVV44_11730 [Spirochaetae bacterium HGW-Spirochaetae-1]
MSNKWGIFVLMAGLLLECSGTTGKFTYTGDIHSGKWMRDLKVPYTYGGKDYTGSLQIYFPRAYKKGERLRTLIVLHGYKGAMRDWETNTAIEKLADEYNFILVCPNMGATLYESAFYPETKVKWGAMPGGEYVSEVLVNFLRNTFALATNKKLTGIMGNSTGARGALLMASKHPDIFGAAAGFSGDYDPLSMTRDRLTASVYGDYKEFKDRWENDDNIMKLAVNLEDIPVFLAHGAKDYIVPKEQSMLLAMKLKQLQKQKGKYSVVYKEVHYGVHDWRFWKKILPDGMEFLANNLGR